MSTSSEGRTDIAVQFAEVRLNTESSTVLHGMDWTVRQGERWAVLGPNGSGKTTSLKLAGAQLHPTSGTVDVLGERLGHVDVRELRKRIGFVSGAITRSLRAELSTFDVVLTGRHAALEPWWNEYTDDDRRRAHQLLHDLGVDDIGDRPFGVVSEGERQQALLARALMGSPDLLLLDEPFAGLDLGARERLLQRLTVLMDDQQTPPMVLVTHHTEEIPPGTTHAALIRDGRFVASGPIAETLTSEHLSTAFGLPVEVRHEGARWWSRADTSA